VEEHFYILLPCVLLLLLRRFPEQRDPFRAVPWIFAVVAIMCIAFRAASVCVGTPNYHTAYAASHDRVDALFFGVLLGYFYHFRREVLDRLFISVRQQAFLHFRIHVSLLRIRRGPLA
jgi:peptidoglycan/LPS O-acetylase OafA/YrhL